MLSINPIPILGAGELGLTLLAFLNHHISNLLDSSKPSITVLKAHSWYQLLPHIQRIRNPPRRTPPHLFLTSSFLSTILKPCDTLISCIGFSADAGKQTQIKIIQAALEYSKRA